MQVGASRVGAWQIAKVGGAVLCGSIAGANDAAVAALASIDGDNGLGCILLAMVRDIDTEGGLGGAHDELGGGVALADEDLGDATVLAKVLVAAQGGDEFLLGEFGAETNDVDEVFLNDAHVGEMLAIHRLEFLLFALLLLFGLSEALDFFGGHGLELDGLVRVLATACWTSAVEILLDVMPAESTNLVTAWAWLEVGVGQIDLFEAQWTVHILLWGKGDSHQGNIGVSKGCADTCGTDVGRCKLTSSSDQ